MNVFKSFARVAHVVNTSVRGGSSIRLQQIRRNYAKPASQPPQTPIEKPDSAWQRFRRIFAKTMMVSKDELTRGNMWEYHQLKKYPDGKVFPAQVLKSPQQFPLFEIRRIYDLNGQLVKLKQYFAAAPHGVTFVICSQKREFASKIIQSWKRPFQEKFPEVTCAEEDWANVLQIKEAWIDMSPQALGGVDFENSFLGYVFVVDKHSNIVWKAVGMAKDYEMDSLFKVVGDLKAQHAAALEAKNKTNEDNNTETKENVNIETQQQTAQK